MTTDTTSPARESGDLSGVAATLVFVQAAILATAIIETWVFASFVGPGALAALVVTASGAVLALACAWGLGRDRRWARRTTLALEGAIVAVAALDVIVVPLVVGAGLTLVPFLTRIVVPLAVIAILRRPVVRVRFTAQNVEEPVG